MKTGGLKGMGVEAGLWTATLLKAGGLALLLVGSASAWAARSYQFSGRVTGVQGDTVAVSHGLETLEFNRAASAPALEHVKVGDTVTIWYKLELQKAESRSAPAQQPGQAAPSEGAPGEKKHIIIDDRAFYDARIDRRPSEASGSGA